MFATCYYRCDIKGMHCTSDAYLAEELETEIPCKALRTPSFLSY
jgi:hypothetical protein